jgi:hypothetical protein
MGMAGGQFTSHPSQKREGWGTRAFVFGLEVEGWATRPTLLVGVTVYNWRWRKGNLFRWDYK